MFFSAHARTVTIVVRGASATAMFVFIGVTPHPGWLEGVVPRDERGFVLTGPDLARA